MLMEIRKHDFGSRLEHCVHEAHARFRKKPNAEALFARATTAFMRELLAVPRGEHTIYPVFQFNSTGNGVVEGLGAILSLLDTESAPAKVRFLLTPDADLGETPIGALQSGDEERRELVAHKARQFGHHTAW
jgi:hypothetical protein